MEDPTELAVKRAIRIMRDNLGEQLTVDDMARAAMFSKFHFTRVFQRATGVSPGRFLSALRLQRAKQLLISTSLNVADISLRVGYNSVGTFSSRFSRSVGMSPTTFRRLTGFASHIPTDPAWRVGQASSAQVHGEIRRSGPDAGGLVFLGLFADRVPEGLPVRCAVLPGPGRYRFDTVPAGTWYLMAQSVTGDAEQAFAQPDEMDQTVFVATNGPLTIRKDSVVHADVELKPIRVLDPPVLLALLDVRRQALVRAGERDDAAAPLVGAGLRGAGPIQGNAA